MSMLESFREREGSSTINLLDNWNQFTGVQSKYLSDSENPSYNGRITWDRRVIVLGIVQETGLVHLGKMTAQQRLSWLAIVSGVTIPYLIQCDKTPGKRSGLSYNLTTESVCYGYFSKKFASFPVVKAWHNGIVAIKWHNNTYGIMPDGTVYTR